MPGSRESLAIARLQSFINPSATELDFLRSIPGEDYEAKAQETICPNDKQPGFFLLLSGWAANSIIAENGEDRISAVNLPGDLLGMTSFVMAMPFDRTYTLTAATLRWVPAHVLRQIYEHYPRLAATIMLVAQEERASKYEWMSLHSLPAKTRFAAFLFRMGERLRRLNRIAPHDMAIPLNQKTLAEVIGVTPVYMNKLIRLIEADGLVTVSRSRIDILDLERLRALSGLDDWTVEAPSWMPKAA